MKQFIESDEPDGIERLWFYVYGNEKIDDGEYAICSDGIYLFGDGTPVDDGETVEYPAMKLALWMEIGDYDAEYVSKLMAHVEEVVPPPYYVFKYGEIDEDGNELAGKQWNVSYEERKAFILDVENWIASREKKVPYTGIEWNIFSTIWNLYTDE
jgi:hypothetical protein